MDVRVLTDEQPGFSEHQSDLLFQALRELLTNVVKHAGVSSAVVTVNKQDRDTWLIAVQDSGAGFDLNAVQYLPSGEHFGLFSIQERMEAMSGWCRIHSRPGEGTTVEPRRSRPMPVGPRMFPEPPWELPILPEPPCRRGGGCCWWMIMPWSGRVCEAFWKPIPTWKSSGSSRWL